MGGEAGRPLGGSYQKKRGGGRSAQGVPLFVEADTRVDGAVFGLVGVAKLPAVPRDPIL